MSYPALLINGDPNHIQLEIQAQVPAQIWPGHTHAEIILSFDDITKDASATKIKPKLPHYEGPTARIKRHMKFTVPNKELHESHPGLIESFILTGCDVAEQDIAISAFAAGQLADGMFSFCYGIRGKNITVGEHRLYAVYLPAPINLPPSVMLNLLSPEDAAAVARAHHSLLEQLPARAKALLDSDLLGAACAL